MLRLKTLTHIRKYSSAHTKSRVLSSAEIRKNFTDFFTTKHDHKLVRSSPVVPFCDPTVAFVNAGMNQFKSVFLGKTIPTHRRVTNSQKCVRVGGKHNDLSIVGHDGYHHTFFEMLGNWSFGDYFKREACEMALELLKGPYGVDVSRLYVTYFEGDPDLNLLPDMEVFQIWQSLGIPESHILPFGSKDNFWEMGTTGPCGPCTEIHIDHHPHLGASTDRSVLVNAGTPEITEIWNLVFIQYNRNEDGSISYLPEKHVDTGMGFERLAALLQGKSSNYDTDLFVPIFDAVQKFAKVPPYTGKMPTYKGDAELDTAYRILADHSRMITACISDGMLPDQNQKLRRVLRKAFLLSENTFKTSNLLNNLIPVVVEILGPTYPEMSLKLPDVLEIIKCEQETFKSLRDSSSKSFKEIQAKHPHLDDIDLMDSPGFAPAFKELQTQKDNFPNSIIPGKFLFKLTDTFGLNEESIRNLAEIENLQIDENGWREEIFKAKQKSKASTQVNLSSQDQKKIDEALSRLTQKCQPGTDDSFKYSYKFNPSSKLYEIPKIESKIVGILQNDRELSSATPRNAGDVFSIITDKSNFYYESGGQQSDRGFLVKRTADESGEVRFNVKYVYSMNNCIVHVGEFEQSNDGIAIQVGDTVDLIVDSQHRSGNVLHHTATHLLNAAVRSLYNKVTYQVSSSVSSDNLKLELGILGQKITPVEIEQIEGLIRKIINSSRDVQISVINAADVLNRNDITLVPGEIYPETGLRLLTITSDDHQFYSNELCCGTHALSSAELRDFCITNLKQTSRTRYLFTAVAGDAAEKALENSESIKLQVNRLEKKLKTDINEHYTIDDELQKLRNSILHSGIVLPYVSRTDILQRINGILKSLKDASKTTLKEFVEHEMKSVLQEKSPDKHPFVIHYLSSSALVEAVPLQKATKLCKDRPILVVSRTDSEIKARCCVPPNKITDKFTAQNWLQEFASVFKAQITVPKGQNPNEVCNMKAKKVSAGFFEQLEIAMKKAYAFASDKL